MKTAIFSDIHANLEGLEAILEDAESLGVDDYACLGDIVGYNANPVECLLKVQSLNCPIVKGNHDFDTASSHSLEMMNPTAAAALRWTRQQLSEEQRHWLGRLRMIRQLHKATIVHATLDDPNSWNYITNRFDAMACFSFQLAPVCFCGHTHVPRIFAKSGTVSEMPAQAFFLEKNTQYIVNVGSVGQPRDGDWRASYCIYDTEESSIHFRRVSYDLQKAQKKILAAHLPESLASRLAQGR